MEKERADFGDDSPDLNVRYERLLADYRKLASKEAQYKKHTHDLVERVKELNCLYTISALTNEAESLDSILEGTARVIPPAMQYPDHTCARILHGEREYVSDPFSESKFVYRSRISPSGGEPGWVEVYYQESGVIPKAAPFLPEEKRLIDEIALQLGNVIERFLDGQRLEEARAELERKARSLEEMNTALKVLLDHQEKEKANVERGLLANLNILALPYIEKLRDTVTDADQRAYLDIIERNLAEVSRPFARYLSDLSDRLTPNEVQIAKMIMDSYNTKQIAQIMHVSESTVNFHRKNIRKKLGLSGRKTNLSAYLQMITKQR